MENKKKLIINTKKTRQETAVMSARLPLSLMKKIDKIATETERTRNDIIQRCLEFALENLEIEE